MAKGIRYSDEFKQEAVNQITKHSYDVAEVSTRLGVSAKSLYKWKQAFSKPTKVREAESDLQAEVARLKRELKRVQQERDILKEAAVDSNGQNNSFTKILICMGTFDETSKTNIYSR